MSNVVHIKKMRPMSLAQAQQHLTDVVCEIFAERPYIDRVLAIGAGHRALERGTPFFEAVDIAEGVLNVWEAAVDGIVQADIARRNRERLRAWRNKYSIYKIRRCVFLRPPCG